MPSSSSFASPLTRVLVLVVLLFPFALASCRDSGGEASDPSSAQQTAEDTTTTTVAETPTAESEPIPSTTPSTPAPVQECSGMTGAEAIAAWGDQVPIYDDELGWQWDEERADTSTYDECAALSWIVLELEGGTASSPYQIMLFHNGRYIGVTSNQAIGFWPYVVRLDDATVEVTYTWPQDWESHAEASGRSVSVFTWDAASEQVIHSGEWPPYVVE